MSHSLLYFAPSPVTLVRARDIAAAGLRLRTRRDVIRVRSGIYAERDPWERLAPHERYLARVHAVVARGTRVVFSHESAAALLGLPIFGEPRDIHIFDPDRTASRRFGDVCVHTGQQEKTIEERGGILLTSSVETTLDLGRVLPPAFALAVADAAVRAGSFDTGDLVAMAAEQANRRGRSRLAWLFDRIDPRSESAGESVSRAVIEWCGFEEPDLQHIFRHESVTDRSDFYWVRHRVVGESDGYGKYGTGDADVMDALRKEKRREDRLRRNESGFARWDWRDSMRATPLARKLIQAGVPLIRRPQHAFLASLASNPRSR